jgi:hypothetical protein
MSDQQAAPPADTAAAQAGPLHVRSDDLIARFLGRDLQSATLRGALYVVIAAAIFATIAALVG